MPAVRRDPLQGESLRCIIGKETASMVLIWLSILFFVVVGIVVIVRREEMSQGIAMFMGATTSPGCAVALGVVCFLIALLGVVLNQLGLFTPK